MAERRSERAPEPGRLQLGSGPAVVALGGGHGLSASLRAARRFAGSVTAVVSVADDGGSSGRLRQMLPDLPAPGDVRRCLGALAADGEEYASILEHRFDEGEFAGHALGNLVLVSLSMELGSFSAAVDEVAARVGAVGRVLPATEVAVALEATRDEPTEPGESGGSGDEAPSVVGQVAVQNTSGIRQLRLLPPDPASPPAVAEAIEAADQVVIGPGSLFTSVLATAIVPDVRRALAQTRAQRVFVANLAPQVPETEGFSVLQEVQALVDHGVALDVVVVDPHRPAPDRARLPEGVQMVVRQVSDGSGTAHDHALLAEVLVELGERAADPGR